MNHTCHALECRTFCRPEHLMCFHHWKLVPVDLQKSLWRHYRRGQETGKRQPTKAWRIAAERCVGAVAVKDRILTEAQAAQRIADLLARLKEAPAVA